MKNKLLFLALIAIFLMGNGNGFSQRVANRCRGEATFAIQACACTIKNRLAAGWSEQRVLEHYYAPDSRATPADIAQVAAVLDGRTICPPDFYFMFSETDRRYLGLASARASGKITQDGKIIWLYARTALQER